MIKSQGPKSTFWAGRVSDQVWFDGHVEVLAQLESLTHAPGGICNQSGPRDRYKKASLVTSKVHLVKLEFGNAICILHRIRCSLGPRRFGSRSGDVVDRTA